MCLHIADSNFLHWNSKIWSDLEIHIDYLIWNAMIFHHTYVIESMLANSSKILKLRCKIDFANQYWMLAWFTKKSVSEYLIWIHHRQVQLDFTLTNCISNGGISAAIAHRSSISTKKFEREWFFSPHWSLSDILQFNDAFDVRWLEIEKRFIQFSKIYWNYYLGKG